LLRMQSEARETEAPPGSAKRRERMDVHEVERTSVVERRFKQAAVTPFGIALGGGLVGGFVLRLLPAVKDAPIWRHSPELCIALCMFMAVCSFGVSVCELAKALWTLVGGLRIVVSGGSVSYGTRFTPWQHADLSQASWLYVPYTSGGGGWNPITSLWAGLFHQTGLFLRFPDNKRLRLCPGVYTAKNARALLKHLSRTMGPVPDYAMSVIDLLGTEREWMTTTWRTDTAVTIGTGDECMVRVQRGDEPLMCKIEYRPRDETFLLTNQSQRSEILYDFTGPQQQKLEPGQSVTFKQVNGRMRGKNEFRFSHYGFYCEALTDKILHQSPGVRDL